MRAELLDVARGVGGAAQVDRLVRFEVVIGEVFLHARPHEALAPAVVLEDGKPDQARRGEGYADERFEVLFDRQPGRFR